MKRILVLAMFVTLIAVSAWAQYDILFNQPYLDGGSASTSALDAAAGVDYEIAENFWGLEEDIAKFVFYGLTMMHDGTAWVEQVPNAQEPFIFRFYDYEEGIPPGLTAPSTGTYTVELYDSYGDGWNGGLLSVFVNDVAVLTDITLDTGAGPAVYNFDVTADDGISTVYTAGEWSSENYYRILDEGGVMIAEDGGTFDNQGASTPTGIAPGTEPVTLEPDWANPLQTLTANTDVVHVGSIWGGERQLYKFTVEFVTPVALADGWISAQIDALNGSGTWFLWLNSDEGDGQAWQRVPATRNRENSLMTSVTSDTNSYREPTRDQLAYDLALEIWGGVLDLPPEEVNYVSPADEAVGVAINGNLSWTTSLLADGYYLYLGTVDNQLTYDVYDGVDVAATTYPYADLASGTEYRWKVVPYNTVGQAPNPAEWTFTTVSDNLYQVGDGTINNSTSGYPAPYGNYWWGSRQQMLIPAAELYAAGMVAPGYIQSLAFDVVSTGGAPLVDFTVKVQNTDLTALTNFVTEDLTTAWGPLEYTDSEGWNHHTFGSPFFWDGVSNLLIETSHWNSSYTSNAIFNQTATPGYVSTIVYRADSTFNYETPTVNQSSEQRPNMLFAFDPIVPEDNDDMAALAISGPSVANAGQASTYAITVGNYGLDTQNNYTVKLMGEGGVELASENVTVPLETFETTAVSLDWTPAAQGETSVWGRVELAGDTNPENDDTDPLDVLVVGAPMSGTYVINHDGTGDYENFTDAVDYLSLVGVDGPVVFEVAPGTYTEQILIPEIMGASETNTISFIGQNARTDAVITYEQTVSAERFVVRLDGAKHIRFDNLSIEAVETGTYGWPLHIMSESQDVIVSNCVITTNATSTSSNYNGIVISGSTTSYTSGASNVSDVLIENNTITGGYVGVAARGSGATDRIEGLKILNNQVIDSYYYGLYVYYNTAPEIQENLIDIRSEGTTTNYGSAVYLYYIYDNTVLANNTILNPGQYGVYMANNNASLEEPAMVYNNAIGGGFRGTTTTACGIYLSSSSFISIYFNSINNDSSQGRGIYTLASATGLSVMNNSLAYTGAGAGYAAYYVTAPADIIVHDHNNYYSGESANFVYYDGSAKSDLAALQAVDNPAGNDQNSISDDPLYEGPFDLSPQLTSPLIFAGTPIAGVDNDIDGNPRNPNNPTIGAYEVELDGYGSLDGYVYDLADEAPLEGALVQIDGEDYSATTDETGYFVMPFVFNGTYNVTASLFGYIEETLTDVVIVEDDNTQITFNIGQLTNVTVSGQVVGSDYPTVGLAGALVEISGYADFSAETDANGDFAIPGVYINQSYTIDIFYEGYDPYADTFDVAEVDVDLGVIVVNEVAYAPNTVVATQAPDESQVDLVWNSPSYMAYMFYDFEEDDGEWIPTASWDPVGDWEWTNTYDVNDFYITDSATATPPPTAYSGTGFWGTVINTNYTNSGGFSYLTQTFDFSSYSDAVLSFQSWNDSFGSWDYGQITVNGDIVWGPAWDNAGTAWQEVTIDLSAYDGMDEVIIQFEHYATTVVAYAGWYIDDVYVGPAMDVARILPGQLLPDRDYNNSDFRVLENYNVYRFLVDDQDNEDLWVELATVTDTTYTDLTWTDAPSGYYKYAVKAVYTNDVLSDPALSNVVERDVFVTVSGQVVGSDNPAVGLEGAAVALAGVSNYNVVTDEDGFFTINLVFMNNNYDLTITAGGYYEEYTQEVFVLDEDLDLGVLTVQAVAYPPLNLQATAAVGLVELMWEEPVFGARDTHLEDAVAEYEAMFEAGYMTKEEVSAALETLLNNSETDFENVRLTRNLLGYNVYRDNVQINTEIVSVTEYVDTNVIDLQEYEYHVTAVYSFGESVASNVVTAVPGPFQLIVVGDGTTSANSLPFNFYWKNSLTQTIYLQNDIGTNGMITEIHYFNNFSSDLTAMPVKLWIGETTLTDLSDGWIPAGELQQVFDGNVDFPSGQNTIVIPLATPFNYSGDSNLVILANRPLDDNYYSSLDHFYYTATGHLNRSRNVQADATEYDPYVPPTTGTLTDRVPNTGFYLSVDDTETLDTPLVTIDIVDGDAVLTWDAVDGANSYLILVSDDPYAEEAAWIHEATVETPGYSEPAVNKRFYRVIASTEEVGGAVLSAPESFGTTRDAVQRSR